MGRGPVPDLASSGGAAARRLSRRGREADAQASGLPAPGRSASRDEKKDKKKEPGWSLGIEQQKKLREFLLADPRLNDEVVNSAKKFIRTGCCDSLNSALTITQDMVWLSMVIVWDAIQDGTLQLKRESSGNVGIDYKDMYDDLLKQFNAVRGAWLQEVAEYRDRCRNKSWDVHMQDVLDKSMDHDVYRFMPKDAIPKDQQPFFESALEECLKMSLIARAGQTPFDEHRELSAKLAASEVELNNLREEMLDMQERQVSAERLSDALGRGRAREDLLSDVKRAQEEAETSRTRAVLFERKLRQLDLSESEIFCEDPLNTDDIVRRWLKREVAELQRLAGEVKRLTLLLQARDEELEEARSAPKLPPPPPEEVAPKAAAAPVERPAPAPRVAAAVPRAEADAAGEKLMEMARELGRERAALAREREMRQALEQQLQSLRLEHQRELEAHARRPSSHASDNAQELSRRGSKNDQLTEEQADHLSVSVRSASKISMRSVRSGRSGAQSAVHSEHPAAASRSPSPSSVPSPVPSSSPEPSLVPVQVQDAAVQTTAKPDPEVPPTALQKELKLQATSKQLEALAAELRQKEEALSESMQKNREHVQTITDLKQILEESKTAEKGTGFDAKVDEMLGRLMEFGPREQVFTRLWKDAQGRMQRPPKPRCLSAEKALAAGFALEDSTFRTMAEQQEILARILACRSYEDPEPEPLPQQKAEAQANLPGDGVEVSQSTAKPRRPHTAGCDRGGSGGASFAEYCRLLKESGNGRPASAVNLQQPPQVESFQLSHLVKSTSRPRRSREQSEERVLAVTDAIDQVATEQYPVQAQANGWIRRRPSSSNSATSGRRTPSRQRSLPELNVANRRLGAAARPPGVA